MKLSDAKKVFDKSDPHAVLSGIEQLRTLCVPRISSGVFVFDYLTGGGIPIGRITGFHGDKSSGKTTMSLRICGRYLKDNPDKSVVFLDFEGTFDYAWAINFIPEEFIEVGRFYVVQPDFGEQGVDYLKVLLATEDLGLLVLDSIAEMIPAKEAESSAIDNFVGLHAKLVNRMLRILIPAMSRAKKLGRPITPILINQIRSKIGAGAFGPQVGQPGGKMLTHVYSLDIRFYSKEYKKHGDTPTRVLTRFLIDKNKVGIPKRIGEYLSYLTNHEGWNAGEVDETDTITTYARRAGLLERKGNKWLLNGKTYKNHAEVDEALLSDPDLLALIKDTVLGGLLAGPVIGEDTEEE